MELGFYIPRLCFTHSAQLSRFESVFGCHDFGSYLTLGLLSSFTEITSELSKWV